MAKTSPHEPGDSIRILDTANQRRRIGYIKSFDNNGNVFVYVVRFDSIMKFGPSGETGMGRFKLIGMRWPE